MASIFLTSTGLTNAAVRRVFAMEVGETKGKSVAIITTAAEEKEQNQYCQLAHKQLTELGFSKIDFVDLEKEPQRDFSGYDVVYVSGGSTFRLLKFCRDANFKATIQKLLDRGGIYVGASAGAGIMCASIATTEWKERAGLTPGRDRYGLIDLAGFNFVPFMLCVHFVPEYAELIKKEMATAEYPVRLLTDEQAFLVKDGKTELIGDGPEIKL